MSTGAGFWRVVDFWAKPELDIVEVTEASLAKLELDVVEVVEAGFRDCFVVGAIVKYDAV